MIREISEKLDYRQSILDNSESLIKYGKKHNSKQLSLFAEENSSKDKLIMKSNPNYLELLDKEKDVLGLCLTHNFFNRYSLIESRFCNINIEDIFFLTKNSVNLLFIAKLNSIEYATSRIGNKYAKFLLEDFKSQKKFYLTGKNYKAILPNSITNKTYLVQCSYNSEMNLASITKMMNVEFINIEEFVSSIIIESFNSSQVINIKRYVNLNLIGSKFNLYFKYGDLIIKAPHKINIDFDNVEELYYYGYKITNYNEG